MGEISGVPTTDIDNVNGFFTTQTGGGGGTASTTPTISVTEGLFGATTVEVTNHSSYVNPNYSVSAAVGATTTVTDAIVDHILETDRSGISDTMQFTDQNAATGTRTISVRAQEFGSNIQSAVATTTYNVAGMTARYIRLRGVTSTGAQSTNRLAIYDLRFFESAGQSGTSHPTNMSSATTDTSGNNYYTIDAGHDYSASYPEYKAFDSSSSIFSMYWALGTSAANNWLQFKYDDTQFSTPPTIKSFRVGIYANGHFATHLALETSNDGSTFTQLGVFEVNPDTTTKQNFG